MPFQLHATGRKIALTAVALVLTTAVKADEIDDLKSQVHDMEEQIRILMQRIEDLEQQRDRDRQAQTQATVESEPAPARTASRQAPGAFRVPGTNTDIEVRGYVKLDLIADFDQDLGDTFDFNEIADDESAAQQRGPHARLHARQSRLQVSSSTQLDKGKLLRTHLQGDFLGAAGNEVTENASGFRLRHAYLTYGSWLFGQTWSNFMENEFVAYPTTVDFFGPAGQAFVRQAQIRYSLPNGLSFAIENPETSGRHVVAFDSVTGAPVTSKVAESVGGIGVDHLPDLTAAWRGHFGPGAYEFGGLLRQLAVDNGFSNGIDDSATGWGLGGAGRWSLNELTGYGYLRFGDGIGRYLINGVDNDVYVSATGNLQTVESWGLGGGFEYRIGDAHWFNVVYGRFVNVEPSISNGIDTIQSIHADYFWRPAPGLTFGVGLIWGQCKGCGLARFGRPSDGTNTRLQFMAQRNF